MCKNEALPQEARYAALELLISTAESNPRACRAIENYAWTVASICLQWMTRIEDDPAWFEQDSDQYDDNGDDDANFAEEVMDRLSLALGGQTMLPLLEQFLPQMISSADWRHRVAGLMAISSVCEGSGKHMVAQLDSITGLLFSNLSDQHPRVQYAAIHAIGQLADDLQVSQI